MSSRRPPESVACTLDPLKVLWLAALLVIPSLFVVLGVEIILLRHREPRAWAPPTGVALAPIAAGAFLLWDRWRNRTAWRVLAGPTGLRLDGGPEIPWSSVRKVQESAATRMEGMEIPLDDLGLEVEIGAAPVTRGSLYIRYADAAGTGRWARIPSHHRGYLAFRLFLRRILAERVKLQSWQG